jgi:NDP-sugar pyrophosphorylase family protein/phosphoglycolate phosphatase-like HAD superfamily hydrolase
MQVVILAGGKGTRLGYLTRAVPKPMVPLAGKPIIEYQIELARACGFTQLILLTGHLGRVIENHFGDGRPWGVSMRYCQESSPLGTAGALKEIEDCLGDDFLVFYGDMVMNVDLVELARFHARHKPLATLVVHPNNHPEESDLVELDADGRVKAFHPKPRTGERYYRNCANAALYVISRGLLRFIPKGQPSDIGRDILPQVVGAGQTLWGYDTPEYIEDVGTPLRLSETERDIISGRFARLSRKTPRGAVFLARDGVLGAAVDRWVSADQLRLLPGAAKAVRRINLSEYLTVLLSHEPAAATGSLSEAELGRIHAKLDTLLGAERAFVDWIDYCPHEPEAGPGSEKTGMVSAAAARLNIDLARSWMVAARPSDIEAGARAGCKTILLRSGPSAGASEGPCSPNFVCANLPAAVWLLLEMSLSS